MCGGEFKRVINEMTKDGPCPYFESKKVLAGYNGLKTTRPDIAKEWGIENYLLGIGGPKEKRGHEPCWNCSGRMKNILKF